MTPMNRRQLMALAGAASVLHANQAQAQAPSGAAYPNKPVRLVVPFPPGSSTDALGREVGQFMAQGTATPWVIDNKPGALATLGSADVARARADGYTLLLGTSTSHAAAPSLFKKLPYDPLRDFTPIGRIGAVNFALVVRADHPARNVQDLIRLGQPATGRVLNWGYANSANRVAGAELIRSGGMQATAVPYKGVPQIIVEILGGQLDFTIADLPSVLPQVRAGKMRALAVTSPTAAAELPEVPTMAQTVGGFTLLGWYALFAPAGLAPATVQVLAEQLRAGLAKAEVRSRIEALGLIVFPSDSEELKAYIASESGKWAALIKNAQIEAE